MGDVVGAAGQTIAHILCCPDTYFEGDLMELHNVESERSIKYLEDMAINL